MLIRSSDKLTSHRSCSTLNPRGCRKLGLRFWVRYTNSKTSSWRIRKRYLQSRSMKPTGCSIAVSQIITSQWSRGN